MDEVICPSCDITIHHPTANKAGRLHCQNCNFSFSLFKSTAAPAVVVPVGEAPESAAIPEPPLPELGAPLQGATFGMLRVLTWVLLGGMLTGNLLSLYKEMQQASAMRGPNSVGFYANIQVLVACANIVRDLIVGLGFVFIGQAIVRIDALAAWLGWRSGGIAHLPEESRSSSLHYILPLCVSGGLICIGALMFWFMSDDFGGRLGLSATSITAWILVFGVVLFMNGLGFGDLSQFFQRMTDLGRGVRLRKRGTELGLGEPLRPSPPIPTNSPAYLLFATAALAVCFGVGALVAKSELNLSDTSWMMTLVFGGVLALIMIGGAYSMYHLSLRWREALAAWEWAAASIAPLSEGRKRVVRASTLGGFSVATYTLAFVQVVIMLFVWALMPLKTAFELKVLMVGGVALSLLFLLWISTLRADVFRFRAALQTCATNPRGRQNSGALPWALFVLAILYAVGLVVAGLVTNAEIFGGNTAMEKEEYASVLGVALGFTMLIGYSAIPLLWLGLMVRDFGAAQKSLAELREKIDG